MDSKKTTNNIRTDGFTRRSDETSTDGFTRRSNNPLTCRNKILAFVLLLPLLLNSQQNFRITPDVVYGHKAGMALTYDVFQPVDSANGAGIIHVVSGSWNSR